MELLEHARSSASSARLKPRGSGWVSAQDEEGQKEVEFEDDEDNEKKQLPQRVMESCANVQRLLAALIMAVAVVLLMGDAILIRYNTTPEAHIQHATNWHSHKGEEDGGAGHLEQLMKIRSAKPSGHQEDGLFSGGSLTIEQLARGKLRPARVEGMMHIGTTIGGGEQEKESSDKNQKSPSSARAADNAQLGVAAKEKKAGAAPPKDDSAAGKEPEGEGEEEVAPAPEGPNWREVAPLGTCDSFFANGYREDFVLTPSQPSAAFCRNNPEIRAAYCGFTDLLMHPSRIRLSAGGEPLTSVMGRMEDDELPVFEDDAFEVLINGGEGGSAPSSSPVEVKVVSSLAEVASNSAGDGVNLASKVSSTGLRDRMTGTHTYSLAMLDKTSVVDLAGSGTKNKRAAVRVVEEPVIFLTRVEYANLFHTSTDWYNVWQTARLAGFEPTDDYAPEALFGLTPESRKMEEEGGTVNPAQDKMRAKTRRLPVHVVFLDGHNASPMDSGWRGMVLSINYAKHFTSTPAAAAAAAGEAEGIEGPILFRRAWLAPFGYSAAISSGIQDKQTLCAGTSAMRQFNFDFVTGLGLKPKAKTTCSSTPAGSPLPVLFVRRTHYLVHPRHDGKIVRRLENEDDIYDLLKSKALPAPTKAEAGAAKAKAKTKDGEKKSGLRGSAAGSGSGSGGAATVAGPDGLALPSYYLMNGMFSSMTVKDQVEMVQQACAIVGAHGAGLSHVLFAVPKSHMLELRPPAYQRPHFISYAQWAEVAHHDWLLQTSSADPNEVHSRVLRVLDDARKGRWPSGGYERKG